MHLTVAATASHPLRSTVPLGSLLADYTLVELRRRGFRCTAPHLSLIRLALLLAWTHCADRLLLLILAEVHVNTLLICVIGVVPI